MAIAVPNTWTGTGTYADVEVKTLPTSGRWVVAVVAWRTADGTAPAMAVGDLSRNLWTLVGSADNAAAAIHVQVWACPHLLYDGFETLNVYAASMATAASDTRAILVEVFEVSGLSDWLTVDSVTVQTATAATSLSITLPAPAGAANCLMVGAAAIDSTAATLTVTSAGWTALTQVASPGSAPTCKTAPTWRTGTAGQTASWSSSVAANWVGVAVAIKETGTSVNQPNSNYPYVQVGLALGYDVSTPLQAASFVTPAGKHRSTSHQRGIQAELGDAQAGQTIVTFDDPDGALAARTAVPATANASGTTTTIKVPDASATNIIFKGDYFQLYNSTPALKEKTVFQVTGLSSAAGTTTVTFTPAASGSTASGDILTTTPLDLYTPYRVTATYGGKTYPLCSGWADTPTVTWAAENQQQMTLTCADTVSMLDIDSATALRGEVLTRSPQSYWPLDDSPGAGAGQNASGLSTSQLVMYASKFGTGAGTADFGASTQNNDFTGTGTLLASLVGDAGSGWEQRSLQSADIAQNGYALVAQDSGFPSITSGVTIMGCTWMASGDRTVITGGTSDPTLMIIRNADPGDGAALGSIIKVSIDKTTLNAKIVIWDAVTHAQTSTTTSVFVYGGLWAVWALEFDQTSWKFFCNGSLATGSANLVSAFTQIDVGGEADQFWNGHCYNAVHAHVAVYPRKLTNGELFRFYDIVTSGRPGLETGEQQIQRKLAVAGWAGGRTVSTSGLLMSPEGTDSSSVTSKISAVAGYEDGQIFSDAAGQVNFRSRLTSYHQTSKATLGENTAGGEIPYQPGPQFQLSRTFLYNLIRIANNTISGFSYGTITALAADPISAKKYRQRPFDRLTRLKSQADAFALAGWLLARFSTPDRRITQLAIDAASNPAAFPFVLGVEVGDLVTVNRRPVGAPAISELYRVLGVQHQQGAGQWMTTLTVGLAPNTTLILGDAVKGVLGSNSLGA